MMYYQSGSHRKVEFFGTNCEGLFSGGFKVLRMFQISALNLDYMAHLLLSDICHEGIHLISLFDQPCKNTGSIYPEPLR